METIETMLEKRKRLLNVYPTTNKDDYDKYEEQLRIVFSNDDINTIAIVGSYGSGKSTLIKTHEKKDKQKYCYISALPYLSSKREEETDKVEEVEESSFKRKNSTTLEQKLIEQIYNQVSNRKNQKGIYFWYPIFSLIVFGISITYILGRKIELNRIFWTNVRDSMKIIPESSLILFFTLIIWIIYSIYFVFSYSGVTSIINRIKIPSIEVQLSQRDIDFDKVTTELIRLLSKSNFNAVVVEDLDRFADKAVIFQLREFANLYNRSTKNKMKFIFLLDFTTIDDEELKAKFFDFSLNIVPYMSYSYSYSYVKDIQKLSEDIGKRSLAHISEKLIKILTNSIHDSRLLRIILSDYIFLSESYYGRKIINSFRNDSDRSEIEDLLLSLSLYKHTFTADYNNFLQSKGNLYSLLIDNQNQQTEELQAENHKLQETIELSKIEHLNDEREILLVEAFRNNISSYFEDVEPKYSYGNLYGHHLLEAKKKSSYQKRLKLLNSNYKDYIAEIQDKIIRNTMRISYYIPKGDNTLKIKWSENESYNVVMHELLFNGYLTSKVSIYISHRSNNLTPEETHLVEQAVSNETEINPSIKVSMDNIPTILSLINNSTLETSKLFNYDLMNYFRKRKQYTFEYQQMIKNLEEQTRNGLINNSNTNYLSKAYFGMARQKNEIYKNLLQDSNHYTEGFIGILFDIYSTSTPIENQFDYFLLIALIINMNLNDILKINSFIKFMGDKFNVKLLDLVVKTIQLSNDELKEIEDKILMLVSGKEIIIEFDRYLLVDPDTLFKKRLGEYKGLLKKKVEDYQFIISERLMQLMFFFPDSKDAKYLNLDFSKKQEGEMINFLLTNPVMTRDSTLIGARTSEKEKNSKLWIDNNILRSYNFTEQLINKMGLDEAFIIFEAIENYSNDKVPLAFREMHLNYDGGKANRWFNDLGKLNEDIAEEIITRNLFKINQNNVNFIFDLFLDTDVSEALLEFLRVYNYLESLEYILRYEKKRVFFTELFEQIFDQYGEEKLIELIEELPDELIVLGEYVVNENVSDSYTKNVFLEYGLIEPSDDLMIYILSEGSDKALERYQEKVIDVILMNLELINELLSNKNVLSLENILEVMKQTNQFNQKTFRKFERIRDFTSLSKNVQRKTFKNPLEEQTTHDLEILLKKELVQIIEKNEQGITLRIKWQT